MGPAMTRRGRSEGRTRADIDRRGESDWAWACLESLN
jgi:hypothetical protein